MAVTPQDVTVLLQQEGSGVSPGAYDATNETQDAISKRIKLLSPVVDTLTSQDPDSLEAVAKALGDGSRDVAWRIPYGDSGILEFFLDILASDKQSHGVKVQALRITGNSCADTDQNRARVVEGKYIVSFINHLQDKSLVPYLIPVLYNVLVDYEPAQRLASESRLSSHLITLLQSPNVSDFSPLVTYFCKILALLVTQDGEVAVADPQTASALLKLAASPNHSSDIEDFLALVSTAASYLANDSFQERLLTSKQADVFVKVYYIALTQFDSELDDEETAKELGQLCTSLLTTLADLTGNDAFPAHYPLESSVPQSLLGWLKEPHVILQSAACLALGNLSRSDQASTAFVQKYQAHLPLIALLSDPEVAEAQLLHAALSFLKNLAIPAQNKPLLGDLLKPAAIPRILTIDTLPQVQFSAVSLLRLLLVNSAENVRQVTMPRTVEVDGSSSKHTTVHDVISLFERSDTEPTKLEAARSVATVCRVLHTIAMDEALSGWNSENEETQSRELFYASHNFSQILSFLITQEKWPVLRSEAWFVFALMSRSNDGARVVAQVLTVSGALDALSYAVVGKATSDSQTLQIEAGIPEVPPAIPEELALEPQQIDPKQQANMAKVDRENCLVLCTEVVKNGETLEAEQVSRLQSLIRQGTELLGKKGDE
ncbi:rap1 gtpase-gdp dissociation stimulator 1 [Fusarium heterosporum]|uniref:Rap1 gtpase-gdp dissociation stimulator 1 n=1 Tax=Fusarium heterosporum TaxID=42747 RepID=A0A8H5TJL9_FUSHE|nr:rap1 gtpase-gdp dissociation stimulator 1 [Fusarium heterosporum]